MLASSGELEAEMGGPSCSSDQARRTIDTRIIRNSPDALLDAFDAPDGNATTPRRNTTTTAPQALFLINGEWALARAEAFAAGSSARSRPRPATEDRVVLAFRLALRPQPRARRDCRGRSRSLSQQARFDWSGAPSNRRRGRPRRSRRLLSCAAQFK